MRSLGFEAFLRSNGGDIRVLGERLSYLCPPEISKIVPLQRRWKHRLALKRIQKAMSAKDLVILCPLRPGVAGVVFSGDKQAVALQEESIKSYYATLENTFRSASYSTVSIGDGVARWNNVWLQHQPNINNIRCVWIIGHGLPNGDILYNDGGRVYAANAYDIYRALGSYNRPTGASLFRSYASDSVCVPHNIPHNINPFELITTSPLPTVKIPVVFGTCYSHVIVEQLNELESAFSNTNSVYANKFTFYAVASETFPKLEYHIPAVKYWNGSIAGCVDVDTAKLVEHVKHMDKEGVITFLQQ